MNQVDTPIYDFISHKRKAKTVSMYGIPIIILEGILASHEVSILNMLNIKVFLDSNGESRLAFRLKQDINYHSQDHNNVLEQYENYVKPAYDEFVAPTKKYADFVLPRCGETEVQAVDFTIDLP